jgi:spore photoproduct lyase
MPAAARMYSHIYVERDIREHAYTRLLLARFPKAEVVVIENYKSVFNRTNQDFWRQKRSPKLILAAKQGKRLYAGNDFLQSNSEDNFAYVTPVMNCPYDCHYCYLQGMFSGANMVVFVNQDELQAEVAQLLAKRGGRGEPFLVALSYDTDLLALEGILGLTRDWANWSRGREGLLLEVRTKSAPTRFLETVTPSTSMRLAWTLSPEPICRRYEEGTPPLKRRIAALNLAIEKGWRVQVCFDPLLRVPEWKDVYHHFFKDLQDSLDWKKIERVEVGVFRVATATFQQMRNRPATDLLHYPFEHGRQAVSYKEMEREELGQWAVHHLRDYLSDDKIHIWT